MKRRSAGSVRPPNSPGARREGPAAAIRETPHLVFAGPGTHKDDRRAHRRGSTAPWGDQDRQSRQASRRDFVGEHLGATAPRRRRSSTPRSTGVVHRRGVHTDPGRPLRRRRFGREAVDTFSRGWGRPRPASRHHRRLRREIDRFLAANDGTGVALRDGSEFESYSPAELAQIGEVIAGGRDSHPRPRRSPYCATPAFRWSSRFPVDQSGRKPPPDRLAGNGRFVRNVVEAAEEEREFRLGSGDIDLADYHGGPDDDHRRRHARGPVHRSRRATTDELTISVTSPAQTRWPAPRRRSTAARNQSGVPTIRTRWRARVIAVYSSSRVSRGRLGGWGTTVTTSNWLPWLRWMVIAVAAIASPSCEGGWSPSRPVCRTRRSLRRCRRRCDAGVAVVDPESFVGRRHQQRLTDRPLPAAPPVAPVVDGARPPADAIPAVRCAHSSR